jgi:methyl-accepting chemotaxis protein
MPAEQDKLHQAELKKERDEICRLKEQLAATKKAHAEEVDQAKSSLSRATADVEKYKQLYAAAEAKTGEADKELAELKAKADQWLSALNKINHEMNSEFFSLF